jgi:CBS domain-containing protein
MKVDSILKSKGREVQTIRPNRTISAAVERMERANIGALVVSEDGSKVDGILSERDVVWSLAQRGASTTRMTVGELMTHKVTTCTADDSIKHLMALMTSHRIRHVPVVDSKGELVGLVSIGDVVKNRLEELELEAAVLRDAYISQR